MSLFRYPGGKSKIWKKIVFQLEKKWQNGMEYREPFFGGGSICEHFLANNSDIKKIWINDKDVGIACLWNSVINHHEEFKNKVLNFSPKVSDFHDFRHKLTQDLQDVDVCRIGFLKLAVHQMSYSGLGMKSGGPLGGKDQKSEFPIDCRWSPKHICKKIDELHAKFQAIETRCTNVDFMNLIENVESEALLYLDPPYYVKGNDLYQYGFTLEDHERLASALRDTKHAWVLSYDDCEEVRHLYEWANIDEIRNVNYSITAKKNKDTGERTSRQKTELLITND